MPIPASSEYLGMLHLPKKQSGHWLAARALIKDAYFSQY